MEEIITQKFCQFCLTQENLIAVTCEISSIIKLFSLIVNEDSRICRNCNNAFVCFKKFRQNCLTSKSFQERNEKINPSNISKEIYDSIDFAFDTIYIWIEKIREYLEKQMIKDEEISHNEELFYENFGDTESLKEEPNNDTSDNNDEESLEQYLDITLQQHSRRPYKCPKCFKYYTRGELRYHLNVHNKCRPFKCVKEGCLSTFSSPRNMRVHAKRFHQIKVETYKSTYQRRNIKDKRYREMNASCLTEEKLEKTKVDVICSICGKEVRKKHFSTHYRTHFMENKHELSCPYKDQGCSEQFKKRHLLTMHIQRNHDSSYLPELGPADRICELCGKCFSKATIKYHMNVHLNLTPYSCDFEGCKESFKDPTLLRQHKRSFHLKIKTWRCRYCPKKILSQEAYEEHKKENCGVKSIACHICGKFINKMNVKCHLAIHKGERNFICSVEGCGKAFLLKNKLQQHSKSHSTELKFECKLCKSAFKVKQSLTTHMTKKHADISETEYKDS